MGKSKVFSLIVLAGMGVTSLILLQPKDEKSDRVVNKVDRAINQNKFDKAYSICSDDDELLIRVARAEFSYFIQQGQYEKAYQRIISNPDIFSLPFYQVLEHNTPFVVKNGDLQQVLTIIKKFTPLNAPITYKGSWDEYANKFNAYESGDSSKRKRERHKIRLVDSQIAYNQSLVGLAREFKDNGMVDNAKQVLSFLQTPLAIVEGIGSDLLLVYDKAFLLNNCEILAEDNPSFLIRELNRMFIEDLKERKEWNDSSYDYDKLVDYNESVDMMYNCICVLLDTDRKDLAKKVFEYMRPKLRLETKTNYALYRYINDNSLTLKLKQRLGL